MGCMKVGTGAYRGTKSGSLVKARNKTRDLPLTSKSHLDTTQATVSFCHKSLVIEQVRTLFTLGMFIYLILAILC